MRRKNTKLITNKIFAISFFKKRRIKGFRDLVLLVSYFKYLKFGLSVLKKSNSQISQDIFVLLYRSKLKQSGIGFFVEFGAADGIKLSNTLLLEKEFNWQGILVEPARIWHKELLMNRNCFIDFRCVHTESGRMIQFLEKQDAFFSSSLQTFESQRHELGHEEKIHDSYDVLTITLNDLLKSYRAPRFIDYLSIDTEGSEFDILSTIDFSFFQFGIITLEHNYGENRESIEKILISNGYRRIHKWLSLHDDWFVLD